MGAQTIGGVECGSGSILSTEDLGMHGGKPTVFCLYNAVNDEGNDSHCDRNKEGAGLRKAEATADGDNDVDSMDLTKGKVFELDVKI